MRVIATAGHVDHGKSTLIEALTGTHPDRLKEERERQMTIDLGFAWWTLPGGEEVGVVDVPGHRDFIANMLAGVGGMDAALLVVAADEGPMPQTREHLAILDLLEIPAAVVALTKIDLVPEEERLEEAIQRVQAALAATRFAAAPIVRVSAVQRAGLAELEAALQAALAQSPPRPDLGWPRLPVDRAFSMTGFGAVLTGTLLDGALNVGDEVELLPEGLRGRVRGLQTHKKQEQTARPGTRTAVNVNGIQAAQAERGMLLARPGDYRPTRRLDAVFRLLADSSQPLRHDDEVKLFIAASETLARVRLLGAEELSPGERGWLQLETGALIVCARGDRFILRRPSPGETLGGGTVLDPHPASRHRRFEAAVLERMAVLAEGGLAARLALALAEMAVAPLRDLARRAGLPLPAAEEALRSLLDEGSAMLDGAQVVDAAASLSAHTRLLAGLQAFHAAEPLKSGISPAELRARLHLPQALFDRALAEAGRAGQVEAAGGLIRQKGQAVQFSPEEQARVEELMARFAAAPFAPPTFKECEEALGKALLHSLLQGGRLVRLSPEVVFRAEDAAQAEDDLRERIGRDGPVTLAQMRDQWQTSRRYVQALLEYFDARGVTVRDGDARRLK
ncbi:MAG: selenocysteine-specific translation elongation factor [Chloroflexi bacterium]|nr:selenocysteine-specific translation elongation factor [Chloroflexota bacterium]